jgi:hypothetical protein
MIKDSGVVPPDLSISKADPGLVVPIPTLPPSVTVRPSALCPKATPVRKNSMEKDTEKT